MNTYRLLAPLFSLSAFAFLLFGVDAWTRNVKNGGRRLSLGLALGGLIVSAAVLHAPLEAGSLFARQMLIWDGLSYFFSWVILLTLFLVVLMSEFYLEFDELRLSAYYGLLLLAGAGLIFLVSANDFMMIFIGIELFGVPSFILAGYLRSRDRSSEAAIKLFLIGAFSTAMLLYGIALIYGVTGGTSLSQLGQSEALKTLAPLGLLAVFFIVVSFGFKIALVPFHMWVPDVFEGAPKPVAALLSVAPKIAGAAIALRVFTLALPTEPSGTYIVVLAVLAALTMTVANMIALHQTHIVRLLAYSSIAHMGYLLLGLVAGQQLGVTGAYMYGWIYLFMNLGAFAVVIVVSRSLGSDELSAYAGLARRSPFMAALMTLFLVSLAGLPPTAGFIAKFYVFMAAYQSGWKWLVALAALNSVISAAYYFRVLYWMYFRAPTNDVEMSLKSSQRLTLALTSGFTILLGVAPQFFIRTIQSLSILPKP